MSRIKPKPTLAVWKFASCDGCQLTVLDCEDKLLELADVLEIVNFNEATKAFSRGPYDISLVDGSITTEHHRDLIQEVRRQSKVIISIGACAVAGGIQSLKNFNRLDEFVRRVYPHPEYISTLPTSTAIRENVPVDFELRGCPIDKTQLLETVSAFLNGRSPTIPTSSVCAECKRIGTVCVMVAYGTPCLGPVTHAGCGALCPSYDRGCYGCFGPMETPNTASLSDWFMNLGVDEESMVRAFRNFNAWAPAFRKAGNDLETGNAKNY